MCLCADNATTPPIHWSWATRLTTIFPFDVPARHCSQHLGRSDTGESREQRHTSEEGAGRFKKQHECSGPWTYATGGKNCHFRKHKLSCTTDSNDGWVWIGFLRAGQVLVSNGALYSSGVSQHWRTEELLLWFNAQRHIVLDKAKRPWLIFCKRQRL